VTDAEHWRLLCTQLRIASERALALHTLSHAVTLEAVQTLYVTPRPSLSTLTFSPASCSHTTRSAWIRKGEWLTLPFFCVA
jgi:hypothetical protein